MGSNSIIVPKGKIIAKYSQLTDEFHVRQVSFTDDIPVVQNINLVKQCAHDTCDTQECSNFLNNFEINTDLSDDQQIALGRLLCDNKEIFVTKDNPGLGCTDIVQHHIILKPDMKPLHQKSYRLTPHKKEVLRHHLDELLSQGVICELSATEEAPITSPVVLVSKRSKPSSGQISDKDYSLRHFRFCVDFRYLNSQTEPLKSFIPDLQELTESFTERVPNYIASIDMSSGFFQMQLSPNSSKYTAFNTCFGTYKFKRVPMGLHTAPNSFQLLMDKILRGLTFKSCLCYLDDVLICSETFQQHLCDLQEVFDRFRNAGLKLNPQKCSFANSSAIFLGHHISKEGIRPPPDRVKALSEFPPPQNVKQLRRALGMFNWFRKFIPNYSSVAEPLTRLLKKNTKFAWSYEQEAAFRNLKSSLLNSEVLAFPRFDLPFFLAVDSSATGIGYMLYQKHPGDTEDKIRVIRFGSKSMNSWQKSYGPTKLELLGVVTSIVDCASYLRGNKFTLECDHQALRPLFQNKLKGAIYDRWLAVLQQFNFEIKYKPAAHMQVPDALSRVENAPRLETNAEESLNENDPYFPYEIEEVGKISFVNSAILNDQEIEQGYVADTEEESSSPQFTTVVTGRIDCSSINFNNDNKFTALESLDNQHFSGIDSNSTNLNSQHLLIDMTLPSSSVNLSNGGINCNSIDCDIVKMDIMETQNSFVIDSPFDCDAPILNPTSESPDITQNGTNKDLLIMDTPIVCDTPILTPFSERSDTQDLIDLCRNDSISISHRENMLEHNSQYLSHVKQNENINIVCSASKSDDQQIDFSSENIKKLQRNDEKLLPIINYLESGVLPKLQKEARRLLLKAADYNLIDDLLFHTRMAKSKRTQEMGKFQLVIPSTLIPKILQTFHESPLGGHMGIQQTVDNISEHLYFQNLPSTVSNYVRSCHACQERKMTKAHTKSEIISYRTPSEPFQTWQVDLFGPLPITQRGNTYVFTAIDMFSKLLFTVPLPNSDSVTVSQALFQLVCTFGVCDCVISDKGSEFISQCTEYLCKTLDMYQNFTPSFIHHCLGLCERTHRTVAERITPYAKKGIQWDNLLVAITFSFNISPSDSTKYSPYEVVYGFRPKFPLSVSKLGIELNSLHADYHSYINQQNEKLKIIREAAAANAYKAGEIMKERENKKTNPLKLSTGDFVYMLKEGTGPGKKLQPKYSGPFIVHPGICQK